MEQLEQFGGTNAVIILVLGWIGSLIKNRTKIHNDFIPIILAALGALIVCFLEGWTKDKAIEGMVTAYLTTLGHSSLKALGVLPKKTSQGGPDDPPSPPPAVVGMLLFLLLSTTACQSYQERFTYFDPQTAQTNHVVHVSYWSLFMVGESAKLRTETQTMEFIRTVNADGLKTRVDSEGIGAAGTATGNVIGAAGRAAAGVP